MSALLVAVASAASAASGARSAAPGPSGTFLGVGSSTVDALLPEALIVLGALAVFFDEPLRLRRRWLPLAAVALVALALAWELVFGARIVSLFNGGFEQDRFALFAKLVLLVTTGLVLLTSEWTPLGPRPGLAMLLLACFGGMTVASATGAAGLWSGLALAVLASAGYAATRSGVVVARRSLAVAGTLLAIVLLGIAIAGASTGSLTFDGLAGGLKAPLGLPLAIALALSLTALLGLLTLGPWLGPLVVAAAGLALLRFAAVAGHDAAAWSVLVPALAASAMLAGALGALAGAPARAQLARVGLVQLGWFAAALVVPDRTGLGAGLYLLAAYLLASTGAPLALGDLPHGLAGLNERAPARAAAYIFSLLSLAGVPPLAGFFGQFAVGAQLARGHYFWLIVLGSFCSAAAAIAVLREVRLAYLASAGEHLPRPLRHPWAPFAGAVLSATLVAVYGVFAWPVSSLALQGGKAIGLP